MSKEKKSFARPDAVVLGYPVISSGEFKHLGSIENLTGGKLDLYDKVSLEKQVKENSSPAFIWGTVNDDLVPIENAFSYAYACKKNGVKFELHLYDNSGKLHSTIYSKNPIDISIYPRTIFYIEIIIIDINVVYSRYIYYIIFNIY